MFNAWRGVILLSIRYSVCDVLPTMTCHISKLSFATLSRTHIGESRQPAAHHSENHQKRESDRTCGYCEYVQLSSLDEVVGGEVDA